MSQILEYARRYAIAGWRVVPSIGKNPAMCLGREWEKQASSDVVTVEQWYTERWPEANVGALTGHNFFVLDIDKKHGGYHSLEQLIDEFGPLPDTLQQQSGGGGRHYLFQIPTGQVIHSKKLRPGVETKGHHGFIVLEPSLHPETGEPYIWDGMDEFEHQPILSAPDWLLRLAVERQDLAAGTSKREPIPDLIPHGQQHDTLVKLAGSMRRQGMNADEIFVAISTVNSKRCEKPGTEAAMRRMAESFMKYEPARIGALQVREVFRDVQMVERSVEVTTNDPIPAGGDPTYRSQGGRLMLQLNGRPEKTLYNVQQSLLYAPHWIGGFAYDSFAMRIVTMRDLCQGQIKAGTVLRDEHFVSLLAEIQYADDIGINSIQTVMDATLNIAMRNSNHPVRNYLGGLVWDRVERVNGWLSTYLGVERSEYSEATGRKWLVSAVARIMEPGSKADACLILEGGQGSYKSTTLEVLASKPWFSDSVADIAHKDTWAGFRGKWIIELSEIDRIFTKESSEVKDFISKKTDRFRPSYGRLVIEVDRENVFCGTTNHDDYFRDPTGGRRFWPQACGAIDIEALARDRDQLWAETYWMYQEGERWHITEGTVKAEAERRQAARYEGDPWESYVLDYCHRHRFERAIFIEEILIGELGKRLSDITKIDRTRVSKVLTHKGYKRRTFRLESGIFRSGYQTPDSIFESGV